MSYLSGEIIQNHIPQLLCSNVSTNTLWIRDFLLAPFLVGLAVFGAQYLFLQFRLPKPRLKLQSIDPTMKNTTSFIFVLVNKGKTALHSPVVNLMLKETITKGDFIPGKTECLIYSSNRPLLPDRVGQLLNLVIEGKTFPKKISYKIFGEECKFSGEIDIGNLVESGDLK